MALKTLEKLNHDFVHGRPTRKQDTALEPISPLAIEVELPKAKRSLEKKRFEAKEPEMSDRQPKPKQERKKRCLFAKISDMLFYLAIFVIIIAIINPASGTGMPKTIFDYSYFTVVSPSMQDEIPQGSFILVKRIDPQELNVGDNITYMADRITSVTHKIVKIYEDYNSSGARGFQTQGVNNTNPDNDIVYEANVVGKVILVLPGVGSLLSSMGENIFLVFIVFCLCVLLSFLIRGKFVKPLRRRGAIKI